MTDQVDVVDLIPQILASLPTVTHCLLYRLPMPPRVEDRSGTSESARIVADLARAQSRRGESFIETFLDIAAEKGVAEEVLDAATFHQSFDLGNSAQWFSSAELRSRDLVDLCFNTPDDEILVLSSRVKVKDQGIMHLPLMDFKLPKSSPNLAVASAVAEKLGGGWLLDSGSSYHLYGSKLLDAAQFYRWLLGAQLMNRYTDGRWITHQLLEGSAALRVSAGKFGRRPQATLKVASI